MSIARKRALSTLRVDVETCAVRAAFSHIPLWQAVMQVRGGRVWWGVSVHACVCVYVCVCVQMIVCVFSHIPLWQAVMQVRDGRVWWGVSVRA